MRAAVGWLLVAIALAGCPANPRAPKPMEPYLLVWAGDADRRHPDFLAVIGADPGSRKYGKVLKTYPVRSKGNEPWGLLPFERPDRHVFATGILTDRVFVFDMADPLDAKLLHVDEPSDARLLAAPMGVDSLPDGSAVVACPDRRGYHGDPVELFAAPGGLLRLDANGAGAVEASAGLDDGGKSLLRAPTGVAVSPRGKVVVTTSGGHGFAATTRGTVDPGIVAQIWKVSGPAVVKTVVLPARDRGDENLGPMTPRFLHRKPTVFVAAHQGGALWVSDSVADKDTAFRVAMDFGKDALLGDTVIAPNDKVLVQAVTGKNEVVSLDVGDPFHPKLVSRLRFDREPASEEQQGTGRPRRGGPAALAIGGEGGRVAVADYTIDVPGYRLDGDHRVYMLRLDPTTGQLRFDPNFRDETTNEIGVDFDRVKWPHGDTGPARPRGLMFVSPRPAE